MVEAAAPGGPVPFRLFQSNSYSSEGGMGSQDWQFASGKRQVVSRKPISEYMGMDEGLIA